MVIELEFVRNLDLDVATQPGRPAHLSAASGLVRQGQNFFVIADDELGLGQFQIGSEPGKIVAQWPGSVPLPLEKSSRKKLKPDFEILFEVIGGILALPSGSKPGRTRGLFYMSPQAKAIDCAPLYALLEKEFSELNLEGAILLGDQVLLFQRGNGAALQNGFVILDRQKFEDSMAGSLTLNTDCFVSVKPMTLGRLRNLALGFTDAAVDATGRLWYLGVAEDSQSTYLDGEYQGAVIGSLTTDLQVHAQFEINCPTKPEGLCFSDDGKYFFVVTDADEAATPAKLYRGLLPKL